LEEYIINHILRIRFGEVELTSGNASQHAAILPLKFRESHVISFDNPLDQIRFRVPDGHVATLSPSIMRSISMNGSA
jgi:hypothetical protein